MHDHFERRLDGGLSGWTVLRLGALFHDVGKSATETVEDDGRIRFLGHAQVGADLTAVRLEALRLSNKVIEHVKQIVAGHMRPLLLAQHTPISRRAIYRYFKATETAGIDIGLLALADHLATYDGSGGGAGTNLVQVVADLFEHYFSRPNETVKPPPLLNGRDLMDALALPPGPEIGRILRLLEEAQAIGDVNTREEALIFIRQATS
jgi:putative nucleotidyltransferase with HDIG domain